MEGYDNSVSNTIPLSSGPVIKTEGSEDHTDAVCPEPINNAMPVCPDPGDKAVSSKPVTKALFTEPINNAMPMCPDPGDKVVSSEPVTKAVSTEPIDTKPSCCIPINNAVNNAKTRFHKQYYKHRLLFTIAPKLIALLLYVFDLGTDLYTGVLHFSNGNYWWGSLTFMFTILPMLCLSSGLIFHSFSDKGIKLLPSITAILCSPILPFGWLVLDVVVSVNDYYNGNDNKGDDKNGDDNNGNKDNTTAEATRLTANEAARLVKIFVVVVESYPQAALQLFIVFNDGDDSIGIWQGLTIATSLTSLAFAVSTGYLNTDAAGSSKGMFIIFGLLAVASRLVVCCVYSVITTPLWLVPFFTMLGASSMVWSISSCCKVGNEIRQISSKGHFVGGLIFVLTEMYNCFTLSGLLTSSISFGFAVGGLFLDIPQTVKTVAITLAAVSVSVNVMITVIPFFKKIKKDWMRKQEDDETRL